MDEAQLPSSADDEGAEAEAEGGSGAVAVLAERSWESQIFDIIAAAGGPPARFIWNPG